MVIKIIHINILKAHGNMKIRECIVNNK